MICFWLPVLIIPKRKRKVVKIQTLMFEEEQLTHFDIIVSTVPFSQKNSTLFF